jgi:hypothetical protein
MQSPKSARTLGLKLPEGNRKDRWERSDPRFSLKARRM